jgi:biopolymer transport protein ExbD
MQLNEDKPYDDINITPMLDLAYVLLVIFILMTTATVQGLRANLPKANNAPSTNKEKPKTKIIIVANDGAITMDKTVIDIAQLEQALKSYKNLHPDFPVLIRGDYQTQYQVIMDILDLVVTLGIKQIGLPSKPKTN